MTAMSAELTFYSIASRWNFAQKLFEGEYTSLKVALESAVDGGADLGGADLRGANLGGADLGGADLGGANLRGANLGGANLGDLKHIPVVADLDKKIEEATRPDGALDMSRWHADCGTTHCRAGWAITLAGEEGRALEAKLGPAVAGALIYIVSTGRREVPNFYAGDDEARADIVRCAQLSTSPLEAL